MDYQELKQIEDDRWEAADQLRANSELTASEYSMPVLGLIFLRHATTRFNDLLPEVEKSVAARATGALREGRLKLGCQGKAGVYVVSCGTCLQPPSIATDAGQPQGALPRALMALSRAGAARRSEPFTASEALIRSRAWGWLRLLAASYRARPAARTSPPSGRGGAPEGLSLGPRGPVPHETD